MESIIRNNRNDYIWANNYGDVFRYDLNGLTMRTPIDVAVKHYFNKTYKYMPPAAYNLIHKYEKWLPIDDYPILDISNFGRLRMASTKYPIEYYRKHGFYHEAVYYINKDQLVYRMFGHPILTLDKPKIDSKEVWKEIDHPCFNISISNYGRARSNNSNKIYKIKFKMLSAIHNHGMTEYLHIPRLMYKYFKGIELPKGARVHFKDDTKSLALNNIYVNQWNIYNKETKETQQDFFTPKKQPKDITYEYMMTIHQGIRNSTPYVITKVKV